MTTTLGELILLAFLAAAFMCIIDNAENTNANEDSIYHMQMSQLYEREWLDVTNYSNSNIRTVCLSVDHRFQDRCVCDLMEFRNESRTEMNK